MTKWSLVEETVNTTDGLQCFRLQFASPASFGLPVIGSNCGISRIVMSTLELGA